MELVINVKDLIPEEDIDRIKEVALTNLKDALNKSNKHIVDNQKALIKKKLLKATPEVTDLVSDIISESNLRDLIKECVQVRVDDILQGTYSLNSSGSQLRCSHCRDLVQNRDGVLLKSY